MTEPTVEYATDVATLPNPEMSTSALVLDTAAFDKIMAVAHVMAEGKTTLPKHLQGQPADCMAIILQSMQWRANPFAVAQKTHIVNGTLGYEAQLVQAVVESSGAIIGHFHYEYGGEWASISGKGDNRQEHGLFVRAGAVIKGDDQITWDEPLYLIDVKTRNSPLWKTNPKQQLRYLAVKNWTRAYTPGALLGVYSVDELQDAAPMRDITPRKTATDYAEAAKATTISSGDADNAISDLEIIAKESGEAALKDAWNGLTKEMRKAIGVKERDRLLNIATAIDAGVHTDPEPEQDTTTIDAQTGEVTQGGDDDNPFAGV